MFIAGVYSGVLGFLSVDGVACEFSVVIRTAVITENGIIMLFMSEISIGAGGAITALSNAQGEYEEMLLKTNSVLPSVYEVLNNR